MHNIRIELGLCAWLCARFQENGGEQDRQVSSLKVRLQPDRAIVLGLHCQRTLGCYS